MPKPIDSYTFPENPTRSDSSGESGRILEIESDQIKKRLIEAMGDEKPASLSRRSGVGDSTLRNILNGATPRADHLSLLAEACSVTVDWLATGRLPKTRAELRAAQSQGQYQVGGESGQVPRIEYALLRQCLGACNIVHGEPFAAASVALQLEYAVDFYNALLPNVGPRVSLQELAARDARSLATALSGLIAMGTARAWRP